MCVACFIPIKSTSERVLGKNFRILNSKKLYDYIIEHAIVAGVFDDIFIDTNSDKIKAFAEKSGCKIIERCEELARNTANGNDLLNHRDHPEKCVNFLRGCRIEAPLRRK